MEIDLKIFSKRQILKSKIEEKYNKISMLKGELKDESFILEVLEEKLKELNKPTK